MISELHIEQSLFTWLQSSDLADDFKPGNPKRFDPNRSDTTEWVYVQVQRFKPKTQHKSNRHSDVTIHVEVKSRDHNSQLGASYMVNKVVQTLSDNTTGQGVVIPIYDYQAVGDPQVGILSINEYESIKGDATEWQTTRLTFTAVAQALD